MKLLHKVTMLSVESYVSGTFSALMKTSELRAQTSSMKSCMNLDGIKEYYDNVVSFGILQFTAGPLAKWEYILDWNSPEEEWSLTEETLRTLLTEEEFSLLLEEGVLELHNCYLEAHQRRDGWWCPSTDFFTRVQTL